MHRRWNVQQLVGEKRPTLKAQTCVVAKRVVSGIGRGLAKGVQRLVRERFRDLCGIRLRLLWLVRVAWEKAWQCYDVSPCSGQD